MYEVEYTDENTGRMVYDNHWPGYGNDRGDSTWGADGWQWSYSGTMEDGSWSRYNGSFAMDGSGSTTSENSDGYRWAYQYKSDGSGSGTIQGPDPGLPAKVSWTAEGRYRIEYADGTVEEWDMYTVMDGVGYGTTGSSGTSGGGGSTGG
jgi:hypothetical protein